MIPRRFFWLFDFFILTLAFKAAYIFFPYLQPFFLKAGHSLIPWIQELSPPSASDQLPPINEHYWIFLLMTPTALIALGLLGNHRPLFKQSLTRILIGSFVAAFSGLSMVNMVLIALKSLYWSRLFIVFFTIFSGIGFSLYRIILRLYYLFRHARGYYARNVLLIGLSQAIEWMAHYFVQTTSPKDYRLLGYLKTSHDFSVGQIGYAESNVAGLSAMGNVEGLGDLLIHKPIHEVIAIQPLGNGEWIKKVIQDCDYMGIPLRIVPEALLSGDRHTLLTLYPFNPFNPLHLPAVVLVPPHHDSDALFFKRLMDVVGSTLLLVLLSPVLLLIVLAIKISAPHLPVFYRWRVVGQKGVEFTGYKFTTMVPDADEQKKELLDQNEMKGPVFKINNDPRVTTFGRFLRKFSLNELPQLWSVLKGDMSLVGPRPAFRHELERYEFWHKRKLSIKPGITCLWQVCGRNKINNFDDWVNMDLEYIDNWSLWLDFKILLRTVWVVIAGTGS